MQQLNSAVSQVKRQEKQGRGNCDGDDKGIRLREGEADERRVECHHPASDRDRNGVERRDSLLIDLQECPKPVRLRARGRRWFGPSNHAQALYLQPMTFKWRDDAERYPSSSERSVRSPAERDVALR
jgi:hypothetical protein